MEFNIYHLECLEGDTKIPFRMRNGNRCGFTSREAKAWTIRVIVLYFNYIR